MLIEPFEPGQLGREQALVGPDRNPDDVVIDPILGKTLDEILADYHEIDTRHTWESDRADGYKIGQTHSGLVALQNDEIIGGLLGPDLAVRQEHRDQGLGGELVLEAFVREGGLATWDHTEPGYTPSGAAIVEGVCTMDRTNDLFVRKVARSFADQLEHSRDLPSDIEEFRQWRDEHDYGEAVQERMFEQFNLRSRIPDKMSDVLKSDETVEVSE